MGYSYNYILLLLRYSYLMEFSVLLSIVCIYIKEVMALETLVRGKQFLQGIYEAGRA